MESDLLGQFVGLTDQEYRDRGGLTSTLLRQFLRAPAKAEYCQRHRDDDKPVSDVFQTGVLCHAMVLEPETVPDRFAVMPEGLKRTTKEGKRVYAELVEQVGAVNVMTAAQMQTAIGVRDSVFGHERASKYLAFGHPEVSVFARDVVTDLLLQCRCDWLCRYPPVIVDLKTTVSADVDGFTSHAIKYGYHLQAVHYLEVCRLAGIEVDDFLFIAVEKDPPYLCQVFHLSEIFKDSTWNAWRKALDRYAQCLSDDVWPGYGDEIVSIDKPRWMAA